MRFVSEVAPPFEAGLAAISPYITTNHQLVNGSRVSNPVNSAASATSSGGGVQTQAQRFSASSAQMFPNPGRPRLYASNILIYPRRSTLNTSLFGGSPQERQMSSTWLLTKQFSAMADPKGEKCIVNEGVPI